MVGKYGLILVCGALAASLFLQGCMISRVFLYHPTKTDLAPLAVDGWSLVEIHLEGESGSLKGVVKPPATESAPWILFFGGNAMGLDAAKFCLQMLGKATEVGMVGFAYRGYDGSVGTPSEVDLLADTKRIWSYLSHDHGVKSNQIIVVGQSLGTGIASYLSAMLSNQGQPPRQTLLLSPYTSMEQVFQDHAGWFPVRWLVADSFRTENWIGEITSPLLLVHGERDRVIGIDHSERLYEKLKGRAPVEFLRLPGVSHNDIWESRIALERIIGWLWTPKDEIEKVKPIR